MEIWKGKVQEAAINTQRRKKQKKTISPKKTTEGKSSIEQPEQTKEDQYYEIIN